MEYLRPFITYYHQLISLRTPLLEKGCSLSFRTRNWTLWCSLSRESLSLLTTVGSEEHHSANLWQTWAKSGRCEYCYHTSPLCVVWKRWYQNIRVRKGLEFLWPNLWCLLFKYLGLTQALTLHVQRELG